MVDWVPVASQFKSLVQATFGDRKGAKETQERFIRQCPVVSQVTSAVQASKGDKAAARRTQLEFLRVVGGLVDSVPLVGHLKGGIHYACGDKNRGDVAMKASSHTSAAIAGGIGGFFVGGPVGATLGGMAAGSAMDSIITLSEFGVSRRFKPEGILKPLSDPKNPGKWVDAVAGVIVDGILGKGAGALVAKSNIQPSALHMAVSEEKKKIIKSLVQLAAETLAVSACTTIASRAGMEFGERIICGLEEEVDSKPFNGTGKLPQIMYH
ncbi:uncharacterized protein [Macrobrachium rosenbergii]|uniref:uncharacterized protein n=1 Tax=Macrobrachium rosenbergii TaxID=79674 RepID=UPI0034D3D1D5